MVGHRIETAAIYIVIVGNIGKVYEGYDREQAHYEFDEWKKASELELIGRAALEPVTLLVDGEPLKEYIPDPNSVFRQANGLTQA